MWTNSLNFRILRLSRKSLVAWSDAFVGKVTAILERWLWSEHLFQVGGQYKDGKWPRPQFLLEKKGLARVYEGDTGGGLGWNAKWRVQTKNLYVSAIKTSGIPLLSCAKLGTSTLKRSKAVRLHGITFPTLCPSVMYVVCSACKISLNSSSSKTCDKWSLRTFYHDMRLVTIDNNEVTWPLVQTETLMLDD